MDEGWGHSPTRYRQHCVSPGLGGRDRSISYGSYFHQVEQPSMGYRNVQEASREINHLLMRKQRKAEEFEEFGPERMRSPEEYSMSPMHESYQPQRRDDFNRRRRDEFVRSVGPLPPRHEELVRLPRRELYRGMRTTQQARFLENEVNPLPPQQQQQTYQHTTTATTTPIITKKVLKHPNRPMIIDDDIDEEEGPEKWYRLDLSEMSLSVLSSGISAYTHLTSLFLNDNKYTSIPTVICTQLTQLTNLNFSNNLLTSIPSELGRLYQLKDLNLMNNRIREIPADLGRLYKLKNLRVEANPITSPPANVLKQETSVIISYLKDRMQLPPPPPKRSWTSPEIEDKIRVLNYNILAEKYAVPEVLAYCPKRYLKWDYRKTRLQKEILDYDCDLIALQEVQAAHYKEFFEPNMLAAGFKGIFKPKSRARTMKDWSTVDGCVIFYKEEKFELLDEYWIEFQGCSIKRYETDFPESFDALDRMITKDQIGIVLALKVKQGNGASQEDEEDQVLLVVNTHIHWDPEYRDVKLLQVCILMEELEAITKNADGPTNTKYNSDAHKNSNVEVPASNNPDRYKDVPIIFCGDFNSLPDSGVYEFIKNGKLLGSHDDFCGYDYGRYVKEGLSHPFSLNSAYSAVIGEPDFTNFTDNFIGCLDYIFYTSDLIEVCNILRPLEKASVVEQFGFLPNSYNCSDHIALLTDFRFKKGYTRLGADELEKLGNGDLDDDYFDDEEDPPLHRYFSNGYS
eukprot:CAMPEP_0174266306 /NCGR_PEP_ID=MMETSP0439-20130205/29671_1 /TAXON_ID=0 /ORGANISM="Stereomyxa ramosa, Strain Chinc5" /LENGTH=739 /DNA_ID=CAMNT_0015353193 /DNA_START=28 /DNA_END=2244 /DNA_ORIENTATION=-